MELWRGLASYMMDSAGAGGGGGGGSAAADGRSLPERSLPGNRVARVGGRWQAMYVRVGGRQAAAAEQDCCQKQRMCSLFTWQQRPLLQCRRNAPDNPRITTQVTGGHSRRPNLLIVDTCDRTRPSRVLYRRQRTPGGPAHRRKYRSRRPARVITSVG